MTVRHDTQPAPAVIPVVVPLSEPLEPLTGKTARDHAELANGTKVFVRLHASGRRHVWSAHAADNSTIGNGYIQKGIVHTTFGTCPSEVQAAIEEMIDLKNDPTRLRHEREAKAAKVKADAIAEADAAYDETVAKASDKATKELVSANAEAAKAAAAAKAAQAKADKR